MTTRESWTLIALLTMAAVGVIGSAAFIAGRWW